MKKSAHTLLLRSLDAPLSPREATILAEALARDPALRAAQEALMAQRAHLRAAGEAATFGPFFAAKVLRRMQETAEAVPDWVTGLVFAFRRVSLPALAVVLLALLLVLSSESSLSWETLTGVEALSAADVWSDMALTL